jgi:hypothetical protein
VQSHRVIPPYDAHLQEVGSWWQHRHYAGDGEERAQSLGGAADVTAACRGLCDQRHKVDLRAGAARSGSLAQTPLSKACHNACSAIKAVARPALAALHKCSSSRVAKLHAWMLGAAAAKNKQHRSSVRARTAPP